MSKRVCTVVAAAAGMAGLPLASLAQSTMSSGASDGSPVIGALVGWLLAGGGFLAVFGGLAADRMVRSRR